MEAKESELHRRITDFMEGIKRDFKEEANAVVVISSELKGTEIEARAVSYGSRMGMVAAYSTLWEDPEDKVLLKTAKEFVEYKKKEEL